MNVANALSLIDPLQIVGMLIVGTILGFVVLGPVVRDHDIAPVFAGYLVAGIGLTYFVFLIGLRYLSPEIPQPVAERTIGTGILWLVFSGGCYLGIRRST